MRPMWLQKAKAKAKKKPKVTSPLEAKVVRDTITAAKRAGFAHRKVVYAGMNGAPDDWFFGYDGNLIIVEFKAPGKSPEDHQEREINLLRRRGYQVFVIDNSEDGKKLFEGKDQW